MTCHITCTFATDWKPTRQALSRYFRGRRWYEVGDEGIEYADADTGLRFTVSIQDAEGGRVEAVVFELEVGHPRVYRREIAEELEAFGEAFEGLDRLEGERDTLPVDDLRGGADLWERANRCRLAERVEQGDAPDHVLPADDIQQAWRWNRHRQEYHRRIGGEMFVPRVMFFDRDGQLQRGVIWPDAIPMVLPEVDMLLVSLQDQTGERDGTPASYLVDYSTFRHAVASVGEVVDEPVSHLQLDWDEVPTDLVERITEEADAAHPDRLDGLSAGVIFERELIEKL